MLSASLGRRTLCLLGLAVLTTACAHTGQAKANLRAGPPSNVSTYHHIRFVRPPGWREVPATAHSGLDSPAAYWTNQQTVPQCTHPQKGESDCGAPVKVVHRDGVLVVVGQGTSAYKGAIRPNATVAGRPATVMARVGGHPRESGTSMRCPPGARSTLTALVQDPSIAPSSGYEVFSIQAYFGAGSTHLLEQQMRRVLATARAVLTPRQRQAALAAAHRAVDGYASTDPQPERQGWQRNIVEVTAEVYPTPITDWNVRHYCDTDQLLKVTLLGRFPHIAVSPPAGASVSTDVHAMDLVVTDAGRTCLSGVRTGRVRADPSAVVLFKR
jgi:hypothetical protein